MFVRLFALTLVAIALFFFGSYKYDFPIKWDGWNGYRLVDDSEWLPDKIVYDGKVIIESKVVDARLHSHYVVGARFPSLQWLCTKVTEESLLSLSASEPDKSSLEYFVLDVENGSISKFHDHTEFEAKLNAIGVAQDTALNYDNFHYSWYYTWLYNEIELAGKC